MSDARRYAVWPDPRSRSRSRALESWKSFLFQKLSPPPCTMGAGNWPLILKLGLYSCIWSGQTKNQLTQLSCVWSKTELVSGADEKHPRRKLCRDDDDDSCHWDWFQRGTVHQSAAEPFVYDIHHFLIVVNWYVLAGKHRNRLFLSLWIFH